MFKLIDAEIKWYTAKSALVACLVRIHRTTERRCFHFPLSALQATPDGLVIPAWLMDSRRQRYKTETGRVCDFIAEELR